MENLGNSISIDSEVIGNNIKYFYEASGPWENVFCNEETDSWFIQKNREYRFFVDYDVDLTGLPKSLAIIPLLSNIIPIAWFYDAEVFVPELDLDFYEALSDVKLGMSERHPNAKLAGNIVVEKLVKNQITKGNESISLFSGGVDATFTAISNLQSNPILATVWGADIYLSQEKEWEEVNRQNKLSAEKFGLGYASIKSSFRSFINYTVLKHDFDLPLQMPSWWYSVQHSIALVSLCAPLAWARNANHIFIASSYSLADDPKTKCCNWPNIDGNVRFGGLSVTHHDFRYTRQEKVRAICKYFENEQQPLNLRVCWSSVRATNCCDCEKCARTIYGIIAEGHDPNNFGFNCNEEIYERLQNRIQSGKIRVSSFWDAISDRMVVNVPNWRTIPHIRAMMEAHARTKK